MSKEQIYNRFSFYYDMLNKDSRFKQHLDDGHKLTAASNMALAEVYMNSTEHITEMLESQRNVSNI